MATTFDVIFLGTPAPLDPTEGNNTAENAGALVGSTFGSVGDPLRDHIETLSPGNYSGGEANTYDTNNSVSNDTFRINGGALQTFDAIVIYNATITYTDGTTDTITAVTFQDTAGNFYLAPETSYNADQIALELKPIRALTLDSVNTSTGTLMADRYDATFDESDGVVDGTGGSDTMSVGYADADGDRITAGDDSIDAGAGNDTVDGGAGADTIAGGTGNDSLSGGADDDSISGGDGADTLHGGDSGGTSNQVSNGTFDTDTTGWTRTGDVDWDAGFVTLNQDSGSGTLTYDTPLTGLDSGDSVNGTGQVRFDFYWGNGSPDVTGTTHVDVRIDGVTYATIETGGQNGSTASVTYLNGASRSNASVSVDTWETILIDLPAGIAPTGTLSFVVDAASESARDDIWLDTIEVLTSGGSSGNDTLSGGDGDDLIGGGDGDDLIYGGNQIDTIDGGAGDDTLEGGTGDDSLTGGGGSDTFIYTAGDGNDTITDFNVGNSGTLSDADQANNDFIDLSAFYDDIWELHADQADDGILNQSNDGVDGVDYSDNTSFGSGSLTFDGASGDGSFFTSENTNVVCFTAGTAIRRPQGDRLIEDLHVGDLVCTADNGPQRICWIGSTPLDRAMLSAAPQVRPVLIPRGVLGARRDLLVSPQHGMVLGQDHLVRAKHLVETPRSRVRIAHGKRQVTYIHVMFDAHQIIFAEGTPTESFFPGPMAQRTLAPAALAELQMLFPDMISSARRAVLESYGDTARPFLARGAAPVAFLRVTARA